jgi:hypothetical protein
LRGTSLALAENVFITAEKGHENYEECKRLSTYLLQTRYMNPMGQIGSITEMLAGQLALVRLILCPCPAQPKTPRLRRAATRTFQSGISR